MPYSFALSLAGNLPISALGNHTCLPEILFKS
jgi:hypothetical protein